MAGDPASSAAPPPGVERWQPEHVLALAGSGPGVAEVRRIAVPSAWSGLGGDGPGLWGLYLGTASEPYQVVVDVREPAARCSCLSRRSPCKHALALLLVWATEAIPMGNDPPAFAARWLARRPRPGTAAPSRTADPLGAADPPDAGSPRPAASAPSGPPERNGPPTAVDRRAAARAARLAAGLEELERWLADAVRGGLARAELAHYGPWERVVTRLVDAQAPALANRVRRIAGLVGVGPDWHERVLAEIGVLHLLANAGRRLATLDESLADSARTALGWTWRQADVLGAPPETDRWRVLGRSDTLEDRIVVRRMWMRGERSGSSALLLSFAAYGQSLDGALPVGAWFEADLHRYPGRGELRCLLGRVHGAPATPDEPVVTTSLAGACDEIGRAVAAVPWIERWPVTVAAAPARDRGRWVLVDHTGSLPLEEAGVSLAPLVAVSGGRPVAVSLEWTPSGLIPLAVHREGRSLDLGPRGGFHERRRAIRR